MVIMGTDMADKETRSSEAPWWARRKTGVTRRGGMVVDDGGKVGGTKCHIRRSQQSRPRNEKRQNWAKGGEKRRGEAETERQREKDERTGQQTSCR
ncbi:hypothetical protein FOPE_12660 [Fonsecaea pedrosoi]|nr:hypothetical protein FOPE_12660 [Fonsecaea pedrosoi]